MKFLGREIITVKPHSQRYAIPFEGERKTDNVPEKCLKIVSIMVTADNKKKIAESLKKTYSGEWGFQFVPPLEDQMQVDTF